MSLERFEIVPDQLEVWGLDPATPHGRNVDHLTRRKKLTDAGVRIALAKTNGGLNV